MAAGKLRVMKKVIGARKTGRTFINEACSGAMNGMERFKERCGSALSVYWVKREM